MAVDHYENFPVASVLLPAKQRPAVEAIYAFARSADDLADEGDASAAQRIMALDGYVAALDQIAVGGPFAETLFKRLAEVIHQWNLPLTPFYDLLSAFRQDVLTTRYADFPSLLDYCRRSANPVGALMLGLYGVDNADSRAESDAICSALQLINFWQDIAIDWRKSRIYLPLDDMARFGVTSEHLKQQLVDDQWRALMAFEITRARIMLLTGTPLAIRLPGRLGWELRLVIQGGLRILERIEAVGYDVHRHRPVLTKIDWLRLIKRAVCMR
jgi:squalene synthase HpnC